MICKVSSGKSMPNFFEFRSFKRQMAEVVIEDVLEETIVTEKKSNRSKVEIEKKTMSENTTKTEQSSIGKNLNNNAANSLDDIAERTICAMHRKEEEEWKHVTSGMRLAADDGSYFCYIPWTISFGNEQRLADKGYLIFYHRWGTFVSWQNLVFKRLIQ